jgi:hypothetical protein
MIVRDEEPVGDRSQHAHLVAHAGQIWPRCWFDLGDDLEPRTDHNQSYLHNRYRQQRRASGMIAPMASTSGKSDQPFVPTPSDEHKEDLLGDPRECRGPVTSSPQLIV